MIKYATEASMYLVTEIFVDVKYGIPNLSQYINGIKTWVITH